MTNSSRNTLCVLVKVGDGVEGVLMLEPGGMQRNYHAPQFEFRPFHKLLILYLRSVVLTLSWSRLVMKVKAACSVG